MPADNSDISRQDKTKLRRIKLRIRHLTEELEQAEDLKPEYETQFQHMVSKLQVALGLKKEPEPIKKDPKTNEPIKKDPQKQPPIDPGLGKNNIDDSEIRHEADNHSASAPPWMKKLYKQVALKTHPDKIEHLELSPYERAEYSRIFDIAKTAIQESHGGDLLYAAESLGINPDIPATMRIALLVSRGEKLKEKIQKIYRAPSWVWCESHNKRDVRKRILAGFCTVYKHVPPSPNFFDKFLDDLEAE